MDAVSGLFSQLEAGNPPLTYRTWPKIQEAVAGCDNSEGCGFISSLAMVSRWISLERGVSSSSVPASHSWLAQLQALTLTLDK